MPHDAGGGTPARTSNKRPRRGARGRARRHRRPGPHATQQSAYTRLGHARARQPTPTPVRGRRARVSVTVRVAVGARRRHPPCPAHDPSSDASDAPRTPQARAPALQPASGMHLRLCLPAAEPSMKPPAPSSAHSVLTGPPPRAPPSRNLGGSSGLGEDAPTADTASATPRGLWQSGVRSPRLA